MVKTAYYGGEIITMHGDGPEYVECVITEDKHIVYVGTFQEASNHLHEAEKHVDLKGKCLMPGFIDPHIHPSMAALILSMEFITPFDWNLPDRTVVGVRTQDEYLDKLKKLVLGNKKEDNSWIVTWGFHHFFHGQISKDVLDSISPMRPLLVWHRSFHEVYLNSAAIKDLEFEDEHAICNHHQVDWDNGHFYEKGMEELISGSTLFLILLPHLEDGYKAAVAAIEAGGITTIADMEFPMMDESLEFDMCNKILKSSNTKFSTYCVPSSRFYLKSTGSNSAAIEEISAKSERLSNEQLHMYTDHAKVIGDGAFFSQLMQMKDGYTDGHSGEWFTDPSNMEETMRAYWQKNFQIHVHTNGDLAMEVVLNIVEKLSSEMPRDDHRTTIEHAGFFTKEQAQQLSELKCLVSANPYYHYVLADKYSEVGLGPERAEAMCPLGLLEQAKVPLALHSDFTMAPAQPLLLAWAAINRVTVLGKHNHPELALTTFTAIRGITLTAAEVLGISDKVGSLCVGKEANFVILDTNPFLCFPTIKIKEIQVLGSVFRGT